MCRRGWLRPASKPTENHEVHRHQDATAADAPGRCKQKGQRCRADAGHIPAGQRPERLMLLGLRPGLCAAVCARRLTARAAAAAVGGCGTKAAPVVASPSKQLGRGILLVHGAPAASQLAGRGVQQGRRRWRRSKRCRRVLLTLPARPLLPIAYCRM